MKYAVFALTCCGLLPVAFWCAMNRRCFGWMAAFLFLPILIYQQTAINFLSSEWYRGTSRGMEVSLIYLVAFAILLALLFQGRKITFFPDWGSRIYLVYFGWSCLSLMNAANLEYGWLEVWKMIMMFFLFAAVYNWLCAVRDLRPLMVGLAVVLVGCMYFVARQHLSGVWQARGPFPHQNSLAVYMLMATPIYFAYYLNAAKRHGWWLFALAFLCGAGCLVRTYSRGALVCFPIALFVVFVLSIRRNFRMRQIVRLFPLVAIGLLGLLLILPRLIERFETAPKSSGDTRVEFARCAFNMMKAEPLFGVGINNWGIKINPPYPYWIGTGRRQRGGENGEDFKDGIVETVYLLVGAECGIPALLLLLVWYGYYLRSSLRLAKRLAGTSWFFLPVGLAGGLTGTYLQSALEWVLKQSTSFSEMVIFFAIISYLNGHWKELVAKEKMTKEAKGELALA